jgi:uncharacterized protein
MATITADAMTSAEGVPTAERAAPSSDRHEALDFVRGAALFGILLMNITGMGLPHAYVSPAVSGGAEGVNLWTWIITAVGFEGTQRALFSILFGAGVILLTSRLDAAGRTDTADIYLRRNLWLVGFGMFNAWILLWGGDILFYYGILGLFLFAFRKLPPRKLMLLGLISLAIMVAWNGKDAFRALEAHGAYQNAVEARQSGAPLSEAQAGAIQGWEQRVREYHPTAAEIRKEIEQRTGSYGSAFMMQAESNVRGQPIGLYRYFFDMFGMMLIGMALFQWGVLTLQRPSRLYWAMVAGGYGIGLVVNIAEARWMMSHEFSLLSYLQTEMTYDIGRLAMTIGHLGALLLFVRSGAAARLRHALASVGRMAFTNYLMHSAIALVLFVGFGLYGQLERHQLYFVVFAIWAFQLVASPLWLSRYRFGPLEWLWRWLTYLERPPFRRAVAAT